MKILYAASNRPTAYFQAQHIFNVFNSQKKYEVKFVGYTNVSRYLQTEYNLDCLLNFSNKNSKPVLSSKNFQRYLKQIKNYKPDLILSDCEIYTSVAGFELGIPVFQYSPLLLYFALPKKLKNKLGIYNKYSFILNSNYDTKKYISHIITNSDKNIIPTILSDYECDIKLDKKFILSRPYYNTYESFLEATPKRSLIISNNFNYNDGDILFTEQNIINNQQHLPYNKYPYNFTFGGPVYGNADTYSLADAFYNKTEYIAKRNMDLESITNISLFTYLGILKEHQGQEFKLIKHYNYINDNIQFLFSYIENIYKEKQ